MRQLENEHGIFTVDDFGLLHGFQYKSIPGWSTDGVPTADGGLAITHLWIPEGVCALGENAFRGYRIYDAVLPSTLSYLGAGAFSRCEIRSIRLPGGLRMEPSAFSASRISSIDVPDDADRVMLEQLSHALRYCFFWMDGNPLSSLPDFCMDIYHGNGETREEWQCIHNRSGRFYVDSDGVLMEWSSPDGSAALSELIVPAGVKAIVGDAFPPLQLSGPLRLPDSLRFIGCGATGNCFAGCTLPEVVLPVSMELFGTYAFGNCHIGCLTIPPGFEKNYCHMGVRQFKSSHIDEIRIAPTGEEVLRDTFRDENSMVYGTTTDPIHGQLCYARLPFGDQNHRLGDQMVRLFSDLFKNL